MPNKKISELDENVSPSGDNFLPIVVLGVTEKISLSGLTEFIDTGEVNTASNLGNGVGLFSGKSGVDLQFKTLSGGTNIDIVTGDTVISISTSRVIASLINVNLITVTGNTFNWAAGKSSTNTVNYSLAIQWVSGVYADNALPAVAATASFNGGSSWPGVGANMSVRLDGDIIGTFVSSNNSAFSQFIFTDVIPALEAADYIVDSDDYPLVIITNPTTGSAPNGKILTIYNDDFSSTTLTLTAFSGGANITHTDIKLTKSGVTITDFSNGTNTIEDLGSSTPFITHILTTGFSPITNLGNWALPVINGTLNNFIINAYIYGDTI